MNTRPPIESSSAPAVLSVAFNHDESRFSVGHNSGFAIFNSSQCQLQAARDFNAGIALVRMLNTSNYLALIGGGRNPAFPSHKLILWDASKSKPALEITTLTPIRGVQLSRTRIVAVLQNSVRVYSFAKPPDLKGIYETADNLGGLCCLGERVMAFPGRTAGQVQLVELETGNVSIIPAHTGALRAMALSRDGEFLATASEKGTIIRIFATGSCARVAERRRGSEQAMIYSLRFSPSGGLLACTSDKGSLHVFDVPTGRKPSPGASGANAASGPRSPGGGGSATAESGDGNNKWGILKNIPWGPFSDTYSFASTRFEAGDEPLTATASSGVGSAVTQSMEGSMTLGTNRPAKGIIGWVDESSLLVVGAGTDARWEKFVIAEGEDGRRFCYREGWKRYLGN